MAEAKKKIPVEEWIPHRQADWVEFLDKPGKRLEDLTPEQRVEFDAAVAAKLAKEKAAKP